MRELMNKNRIRGVLHRTSVRWNAKSRSIKGAGRRSGGCAQKVVELTSGEPVSGCSSFGFATGGFARSLERSQASASGKVGPCGSGAEVRNGAPQGVNGKANRTRDS